MIYLKDGNIPLNLAYDDDIVQEANSTYQLSFKFPLTDGKWNLLKREVFLLSDDLHGEQEFFIFEAKKANGYVQVYAKQVATLLNYYSVNTISVDRVPGQTVMTALAGSIKRNCPFTFFSDIMDRHTFNESNVSVMDALVKDKHSIVGQWGGDLVRDKYQVKLLKNGGIENESLFMYKKNLSSYEESENINNLKTRLHLKKTIQGQSEGEADRVIAVTVDSPLIGQYRQIYEADIEVNDQDVTDEASLLAYGQRYFGSTLCDLVENSINLDVKGKSDVSVKMFDTVSVFHERFDVDLRLKITSYHFGPMSKRLKSIGFGKVSQSVKSTVASMVAGSVDKATGRLSASFEQKLQKEIDNANRHFDAEFEKRVEEINDGIEQSKADAEAYADTIKQQIDGQLAESNRQYQQAQQTQDRQIAESLRIAGTSTNLANAARALAEQANNDLVQVKASAESQARLILEQSQRQSELINRVTTVENVVDGTKVTVTELSKTLNKATGDIDSVTSRTKTVEDNLSQTRAQYEHLTQTVNAQTGQIDSINRKTVDLQSGIDGVTQRFENLQIGGNNLLKNTKDFSGEWDYNGQRRKIAPWKYNGLSVIEADYPWEGLTQLIQVRAGEVYTFSAYVASSLASDSAEIYIHLNNYRTEQMAVVDNYYRKFNMTATFQRVSITFKVITDGYIAPRIERSDLNGILYFAGMKLERGTIATDWSTSHEDATNYADAKIAEYKHTVDGRFATIQASVDGKANQVDFQAVKETAQLYERIIGSTETGIKDKVARMVMADSLFSTEVKDKISGTATQVNQLSNSWAVKNLTSAGTVLNQINLMANGTNRIDGRLTHITGQTLIDNGVIKSAMIGELDAGKLTAGYISSNRFQADSITGDKLVMDSAFFNKFAADEAKLKQLFAKTAFITSVQAVTMSAGQIVGGVLKATNGAAEFDLNNAKLAFNSSATIEFNSSGNALIRKVGDVTGFLHFNNAAAGGTYVGLGVTSHNEGVKSQDTGRFAGIRIFRSNDTTDQTEIYGDKIYLSHGFNGNGITITATKLSTSYELVDVINSVRALWRCWLHWNGTGWNPDDMAMRRSVINEYNTYNIG
ncbi:TPA: phage tail protein [Streptococcus suis]|nr:phage tail protein [Streptococcus suis]HEM6056235.1 phage tail protein [Streptococcus suis]HEM6133463.1 phage tail protein [Streptococcus suis]HEM6150354.1 phage tail protein [Streptococcus suis]HEM6159216.1 phage tail protein [Streptococcus suis]